MPGTWLMNNHLPGLELQDVLDTSLLHFRNSSAFFCPRGFPEPSPGSFQQPTNTPTPQARVLRPRSQLHPRLSRRSRLSAAPVHCLSVPPQPICHPTATAQTLSISHLDICHSNRCSLQVPVGYKTGCSIPLWGHPEPSQPPETPLTWLDHPHPLPS